MMLEKIDVNSVKYGSSWHWQGDVNALTGALAVRPEIFEVDARAVYLAPSQDEKILVCSLAGGRLPGSLNFSTIDDLEAAVDQAVNKHHILVRGLRLHRDQMSGIDKMYFDNGSWRFQAGGQDSATNFVRAEAPGRGILYQGEFANPRANPHLLGPVSAAIMAALFPILPELPDGLIPAGGFAYNWEKPWGYLKHVENSLANWHLGQGDLQTIYGLLVGHPEVMQGVRSLEASREDISQLNFPMPVSVSGQSH
jgi:hypothetical protein